MQYGSLICEGPITYTQNSLDKYSMQYGSLICEGPITKR